MLDTTGHSAVSRITAAGPSGTEFVALCALLMSLVAMAIDAMLPALGHIAGDLGVSDTNDVQLVISTIFMGLAVAQLGFGPISDSIGRKPTIYISLVLFCVGTLVSLVAGSFTILLVGRFLQGFGAAGPKIVTVALVRDKYEGEAMARIMSTVLAVFIVVPAIAPSLGQVVLWFAPWRAIFGLLLLQGVVALFWFAARQPETLPAEKRRRFSMKEVWLAARETCSSRVAFGYTLVGGVIFGAFLGYLNSAQQIFQVQYGVGKWFSVYFGVLAIAVGCATIVNARIVMRLGMARIVRIALWSLALIAAAFLAVAIATRGEPKLWLLMSFLVPCFFCIGILFGNVNALAMQPMGHIAGTAAAVIASLSTLISLVLGLAIGRAYSGTILPLSIGLASLSVVSLPILYWIRTSPNSQPANVRGS